ncbi:MAG TPA: hypothetical protein VIX89_12670 [Bryobacteraceae bacterium]
MRTTIQAAFLTTVALFVNCATAANLKVMKTGLGSGTVTSSPAGINCGATCDAAYGSPVSVTLTATPAAGSTFTGWGGDCSGVGTCTFTMSADRSVRVEFGLTTAIPTIADFTPTGISNYLTANPTVNTPGRFIKALPSEHKQNWLLMPRSESLQTGTAEIPRLILPSADARFVFTVGMATHGSYPGSHPNAIEFMQWDATEKNFRFHEIVLDAIPAMGTLPARSRGVSVDDVKCGKCHSTRNVINNSTSPGTTGIPPGTIKFKSKPNWDAYDSWGGLMAFNRDRIYQGSVEAAAFRKILNLWTWRANDVVRTIIEQLELQPPGILAADVITRTNGGTNDGHIDFAFDVSPPVLIEPAPSGPGTAPITYSFNGLAEPGPGTSIVRGGSFTILRHSAIPAQAQGEGRGVRLFDALGGLAGDLNPRRIADEIVSHRFATGSVPIEVRPLALAITKGCLAVDAGMNTVTSTPLLTSLPFFTARNGMTINDVVNDTRTRAQNLTRRKADIQKINLDRSTDPYLLPTALANGLIQQYGTATSVGTDTSIGRLRQEVFRRPIDLGFPDATVMGGVYVDRELYSSNTEPMALYRYFLEPLGVSVDKWSMGVRGRSRTYTFADVFGAYLNVFQPELQASLTSNPVPGLSAPFDCPSLITAVNTTFAALPPAAAVPTYTDVQRIFNKSCIECHGGLGYPPYQTYGTFLDLSENESPPLGEARLERSHGIATSLAMSLMGPLYQRITGTAEDCPFGLMPCGGPSLSKVDIETIRRWIVGGNPNTEGDPHIKTIDGVPYDFQSSGEFVLLRGENLEIQTRQTPVETESPLGPNDHTGLTSCVSLNTAAAVRIGKHRITYEPNLSGQPDRSGLQLRIDGKLTEMSGREILLPSGDRIIRTTAPGGIQIESPGGTVVVITPNFWEYYQVWYMNVDVRQARATQGVMGAIAPGNWLPELPDGSFLGPRPTDLHQRFLTLYGKFANAWRVSDATSLFDYAPGTSTGTFTIASWPVENPRSCTLPRGEPGTPPNKPPAKALTLEAAKQQCRAIVADDRRANCEQDVMVTGETGFAATYLQAEKIERNAPPTVPVAVLPEDNKVDLGNEVTFTWKKSSDPDGDPVTYKYCVWDSRERFTFNACGPVTVPPAWRTNGSLHAGVVALVGCLLLAVLLFKGLKKKPGILSLAVIVIVAAVILAFYVGRTDKLSKSVAKLDAPSKTYFWKVIAEDDKGRSAESETHRFTVK